MLSTMNCGVVYLNYSIELCVFGTNEQILVVTRFDNLGKGASGAAVQCVNIMMGVDENTGLQS